MGNSYGEIRDLHKGVIVDQVIEGAYEVLNRFDIVTESREEMKSIQFNRDEQWIFAETAFEYHYENQHNPLTLETVLRSRRREDDTSDIWTVYKRTQKDLIKGGIMVSMRKVNTLKREPSTVWMGL